MGDDDFEDEENVLNKHTQSKFLKYLSISTQEKHKIKMSTHAHAYPEIQDTKKEPIGLLERLQNPVASVLDKYYAFESTQELSEEAHTKRWRKEIRKFNRREEQKKRYKYKSEKIQTNADHVKTTHNKFNFDSLQSGDSSVRVLSDEEIDAASHTHTHESAHTQRDAHGLPIDPIRAPRPTNSKIVAKKPYVKFTLYPSANNRMSLTSVCGGKLRGKKLLTPSVYLRPMMSKVREALFSFMTSAGFFVPSHNTTVLDLFCGTGSCGIESLSRGATKAVFVDISTECCEVAAANLEQCRFSNHSRVIRAPAEEVLQSPSRFAMEETFDAVFICPPYEEVSYSTLMYLAASSPILKPDTIVFVEFPKELGNFPTEVGSLKGYRCRYYGRTVVAVYVCNPTHRWNLKPRIDEFV